MVILMVEAVEKVMKAIRLEKLEVPFTWLLVIPRPRPEALTDLPFIGICFAI